MRREGTDGRFETSGLLEKSVWESASSPSTEPREAKRGFFEGPRIAIVDYGMGNLRSVQKGFERVGYFPVVASDPAVVKSSDGVVLPGVGAFADAMRALWELDMIDALYKVFEDNKPFLGICLGLQLLFSEGEEFGLHKGLDVIEGRVVRFGGGVKVPHMGWDQIEIKNRFPLSPLRGIESGSYFYFVHSYYVIPEDKSVVATTTHYGVDFASSIQRGNIFATQFHPEKSQKLGLKVLENFGEFVSLSRCRGS
ncbi:MAG: imidazole glycerol phosphate synthase subunit HisH [bacterium]